MEKLSQKIYKFISFGYLKKVKNPLIILNKIYLHIAIIFVALSTATSFGTANIKLSNKFFEYASYTVGIIILNAITFAIYETLSKRTDLLE